MLHDAVSVKIDAVRAYGANVEFVDTQITPRAQCVAELLAVYPGSVEAKPSDGQLVLKGNESLGLEIFAHAALRNGRRAIGGGGVIVGLIRCPAQFGHAGVNDVYEIAISPGAQPNDSRVPSAQSLGNLGALDSAKDPDTATLPSVIDCGRRCAALR